MKWPWQAAQNKRLLVLHLAQDGLSYVLADTSSGAPLRVLRWGVEERGDASLPEFARRVRGMGLGAGQVVALLGAEHYQILKIETPNVPQDELKAAARWQIKEMVEAHLDDLTLDVMHVGGDAPRAQKHLFVVAAANTALRELTEWSASAGLSLDAVDIWETAQRNLQSAAAQQAGLAERATAALMVQNGSCLLTVSARDELFYTRRLDWDERLRQRALGGFAPKPAAPPPLGFEYMPGDDIGFADDGAAAETEGSAMVIELQRSIDVWERSWPDLPLALLQLKTPEPDKELATLLQRELGLRTQAMELAPLFSGFEATADNLAAYAACLPLLGALLRSEQRKP